MKTMTEENKYYVTYNAKPHPDGIWENQIPEGHGATDALLSISILRPSDGSFSIAYSSLDGKTCGPISDGELFKVWTMLSSALANSETLDDWKRNLAESVINAVREVIGAHAPAPPK